VRGRGGGFCIARPAEQINLLEVLTALGGPLIDPDHCQRFSGQLDTCVHVEKCSVHYVLGGLAGYIAEYLSKTTLQDILDNKILTVERKIESHLTLAVSQPITIDRSKLKKEQSPKT
jgi:Rrf2 family iron-sulfur cluster assembly transcriptional regulator